MTSIDPFGWHGPLTTENLPAVVEAFQRRLADRKYLVLCHATMLFPDACKVHLETQLRDEDPIKMTLVDKDGMFHISDTSEERVWVARTDSHTHLSFQRKGIILQYSVDNEHIVTITFLTEVYPLEACTSNQLDLSTCSLSLLCWMANRLYFEEGIKQGPIDQTDRALWLEERWTHFQASMNLVMSEIETRQAGQTSAQGLRMLEYAFYSTPSLLTLHQRLAQELIRQHGIKRHCGIVVDLTGPQQAHAWIQSVEALYLSPLHAELIQRNYYKVYK